MERKRQILILSSTLFVGSIVCPSGRSDSDIGTLLTHIKAVGREGSGNVEASKAWRELAGFGPEYLPMILGAMDGAGPTAANWLRVAIDAIADRSAANGRPLPAAQLEAFVLDRQHDEAARRLAYEWLTRVDPKSPERLLPDMLHDPSVELRRDAVARVITSAQAKQDTKDQAAAAAEYRKALSGARDKDQVDLIAKQLKSLGAEVDVAAHFGFIRNWMIIGPFDNRGEKGFEVAYPPEKKIDLAAPLQGKNGLQLEWRAHTTRDSYGLVDLNKAVGKHMGAVGYAYAAISSPIERPIEIRAGSNNAVKLFLNGKQIFFREEYHHGNRFDGMVGKGTLKTGRNEVLIKVCQNEQKDNWAQSWGFQLRLCDAIGGAIPFKVLSPK